jgi:hypothetical protein
VKTTNETKVVYETSDVASLVGISPIYLNKFIERRSFGLAPSVRSGKGRGKRRLFSEADVFGIALVWWLFEAGLRSNAIQEILKEIGGRKPADAKVAAQRLIEQRALSLLIQRRPRIVAYTITQCRRFAYRIGLPETLDLGPELLRTMNESAILVPVGHFLEKLKQAIRKITKGG